MLNCEAVHCSCRCLSSSHRPGTLEPQLRRILLHHVKRSAIPLEFDNESVSDPLKYLCVKYWAVLGITYWHSAMP